MITVLKTIKDCLVDMLNYAVFFCVLTVAYGSIFDRWPGFFIFMIPAVVPLYFYFVRKKAGGILPFCFLHFIPASITLVALHGRSMQEKAVITGVVFVQSLLSVRNKFRGGSPESEEIKAYIAIVILGSTYFLGYIRGNLMTGDIVMGTGLFFVFFYLIHFYIRNFLEYVEMNQRVVAGIPVRKIFVMNGLMAAGFAVTVSIIARAFADNALLKRIAGYIKNLILSVLHAVADALPEGEAVLEMSIGESERETIPPFMPFEEGPAPVWTAVLDFILTAVTAAAALVLVFLFLRGLVWLIRRIFAGKYEKADSQEKHVGKDVVERLDRRKRKKKTGTGGRSWGLNPDDQVRSLFKKAVGRLYRKEKGKGGTGITAGQTARELGIRLGAEEIPEMEELTLLYEKARYGRGLCTREDVRRARLLVGSLSRFSSST